MLWRRFTPLEEQLLGAVRSALPASARATFDAQVAGVTLVQRGAPSWTEIIFYRRRSGRVDWSDVASFARAGEFALAEVVFRVGGRRFRSRLTCLAGHIADFATQPGPKEVAFAAWDPGAEPRLIWDPSGPGGEAEAVPVPVEWTAVAERYPSAGSRGWRLHGAASAYAVALEEGEFLVLAERDGNEFLMFRTSPPGGYWALDGHDAVAYALAEDVDTWLQSRLAAN
jgi:hypothetical protein